MEPATIGLFFTAGGLLVNALAVLFARHDRSRTKEKEMETKTNANSTDIKVLENELKNLDRRTIDLIHDIKKMDERWQAQIISMIKDHISGQGQDD